MIWGEGLSSSSQAWGKSSHSPSLTSHIGYLYYKVMLSIWLLSLVVKGKAPSSVWEGNSARKEVLAHLAFTALFNCPVKNKWYLYGLSLRNCDSRCRQSTIELIPRGREVFLRLRLKLLNTLDLGRENTQNQWIGFLSLALSSCVTLGKSFNLSLFSHLQNGNNDIYVENLCQRLRTHV